MGSSPAAASRGTRTKIFSIFPKGGGWGYFGKNIWGPILAFNCPRGKSLYAIYIPTRYTITGHQTDTPFARTTGHGLGREGPTRGRLTPTPSHTLPIPASGQRRENSSARYSAGQGMKTKAKRDK